MLTTTKEQLRREYAHHYPGQPLDGVALSYEEDWTRFYRGCRETPRPELVNHYIYVLFPFEPDHLDKFTTLQVFPEHGKKVTAIAAVCELAAMDAWRVSFELRIEEWTSRAAVRVMEGGDVATGEREMIATPTVFNSRDKFHEKLNTEVLDHVGTAISKLPEFAPAAVTHGEYHRLAKLRAALVKAVGEFEEGK